MIKVLPAEALLHPSVNPTVEFIQLDPTNNSEFLEVTIPPYPGDDGIVMVEVHSNKHDQDFTIDLNADRNIKIITEVV